MVHNRSVEERALEDPIHTTTNYTSTANIVVNVSIPASLVTEGRGISINILPKSNRRVEVHTERISERSDNESDHGLPFTVDVSRLNINEAPRTPARRNNTVVFDTSSSARQSPAAHTTYTPATAPGTPASGIRSSRWDDAVSVSDEEDEELVPIYPSPSGQREVAHHDQGDGRRYYVVTKGKKIGIFYTTWNVIEPVCMRNLGGSYTMQTTFAAAKASWKATPRHDRRVLA